jgi:predicted AAA+ superfamily ATPase
MDATRALSTGCLPEPYLEGDRGYKEKLVGTYAATYLREEIQAEALTRNLEGFSRFLTVAAEASGRFLDFSKLASKSKVARQSAVRFFEILEDTLIARRVAAFPHAPEADLVKHPRYFFFDAGVLNGLLGNFTVSADRVGNLFEHLLFNQIHHSSKAKDLNARIWNFRTRGGVEIDFVVEIGEALWAIEAKSSDAGTGDVSAFESVRRHVRKDHRSVITTLKGPRKKLGRVEVLPWQQLLREMGL